MSVAPPSRTLGDVRVVHQRQRLPLGLEAGDDLRGVHAGLDDLQRHLAADRLGLLGHVDDAHAAFADLLQQLVGADDGAGPSVGVAAVAIGREQSTATAGSSRKLPGLIVGRAGARRRWRGSAVVAAADLLQAGIPLLRRVVADQVDEDVPRAL